MIYSVMVLHINLLATIFTNRFLETLHVIIWNFCKVPLRKQPLLVMELWKFGLFNIFVFLIITIYMKHVSKCLSRLYSLEIPA